MEIGYVILGGLHHDYRWAAQGVGARVIRIVVGAANMNAVCERTKGRIEKVSSRKLPDASLDGRCVSRSLTPHPH